jgi:hypothetical protein
LDKAVLWQDAIMLTPYPPSAEQAMCLLFDSLGERERRLFAAAEALKLGRGGLAYLARLFACDQKTIRRGISELHQTPTLAPGRSRKKGAVAKPA